MRLIKSLPLLIILSFFSWDSYSQKTDSLELNFSINFLPSPHYIHESYLIINKKAFHTFDKGTLNASSNWKKRERKKKKIGKATIYKVSHIVQDIINKDTNSIIIPNLKIINKLKEKYPKIELSIGQKLLLNFKKYAYKLDSLSSDTSNFMNTFFYKRYLGGIQIDGIWLSFYMKKDSNIVFDYTMGIKMFPVEAKDMKVWLSFYTIANSSRAFSRSKLKTYFKEEELGRFLMHYFEVMAA